MPSGRIYLLLTLFVLAACREWDLSREQSTSIALFHLTLSCDESIESEYYLRGQIGGTEFCHYPGYEGYTIYTVPGNTFVTTVPYVSTGDTSGISDYSRFFSMSFYPDYSVDFPEERVSVRIKLPDEGNFAEEFLKLMQEDQLPFIDWKSENPGVVVNLELSIRTNYESDGHTGKTFTSSIGDQSNSYFYIEEFTVNRSADYIYGTARLRFAADLYHSPSHGIEGFWNDIEAEMYIPYQVPL